MTFFNVPPDFVPPWDVAQRTSRVRQSCGAMSYPPPVHLMRDLGAVSTVHDSTYATGELTGDGPMTLGELVTFVDLLCARVALPTVAPSWTVTADISVATAGPVTGPVAAEARLVKSGKKLVTVRFEAPGVRGITTFARLPGEVSKVTRNMQEYGVPAVMEGGDGRHRIAERLALRTVAAGVVELDRSDYVNNSFGAVNGGVLGFVAEAAASSLAGGDGRDITLRYLGQADTGPVRAIATTVRDGVCTVETVDAGTGRLLTLAVVTLG